jgi:hypothetical protein
MRTSKAERRVLALIPEVKALSGRDDREIARWLISRVERRASVGMLALVAGAGAVEFPEPRKRMPKERGRKGRG